MSLTTSSIEAYDPFFTPLVSPEQKLENGKGHSSLSPYREVTFLAAPLQVHFLTPFNVTGFQMFSHKTFSKGR